MTRLARRWLRDLESKVLVFCAYLSGATYAHCDVTKWDDLLDLHELAVKKYGTVDVVVPNAGINEVEDIWEDKFDANGRLLPPKHILMEVNLKGVFNSTHLI